MTWIFIAVVMNITPTGEALGIEHWSIQFTRDREECELKQSLMRVAAALKENRHFVMRLLCVPVLGNGGNT